MRRIDNREPCAWPCFCTYAIQHGIDTVEVVINDSEQALDTVWNIKAKNNKGYFNGLLRVLAIYNSNTEYYNIWAGEILTELHDVEVEEENGSSARDLTIIVYSMPYTLSRTYPDDLGVQQRENAGPPETGKELHQ